MGELRLGKRPSVTPQLGTLLATIPPITGARLHAFKFKKVTSLPGGKRGRRTPLEELR
jgi:hypothetical protein